MSKARRPYRLFNTAVSIPVLTAHYAFTTMMTLIIWVFAAMKRKRIVQGLIRFWARTLFMIMGKRLRVIGLEHIDRNKKYVLIANHASMFDITAILTFFPGVSWFGREHLLKIPIFGNILKMIDFIPMSPADFSNTKRMLEQLIEKSHGRSLAMFPEGTRTLDGQINPFRKGFARVIKSTDLDLLPVTLNGFHSLRPKNRFWIDFRSRINVTVHPPIKNELLRNRGDEEIIRATRDIILSTYQLT
jgi:1-acyl-sn-glycerol-3-phosphate acyltransferase